MHDDISVSSDVQKDFFLFLLAVLQRDKAVESDYRVKVPHVSRAKQTESPAYSINIIHTLKLLLHGDMKGDRADLKLHQSYSYSFCISRLNLLIIIKDTEPCVFNITVFN